ncbi:MAG TPA: tetratricopeptide repeat protein [Candidatus Eremiobacteraceae bacterium]|nr:tetratricopeptide repeat protein [Candidatus Eremiobacteraceae bacterium]
MPAKKVERAHLPTGEVAFLFTDIEGSTRRWEAQPDQMKAAVARHEQIVSSAIDAHGGHVFKSLGDAFCVAFQTPRDAIAAASHAQRTLEEEDFSAVGGLRVRMGVHTGTAEERGGDYYGTSVNRAARIMSIGHGGQVLVSGATAHAVSRVLPPGATLIDLGLRRLKDLTQPEHVWQLATAGLQREFPPLNSLDARANNLPIQLTTLLGRAEELEEVKALVSNHRLLTISGAGGIGKTRLALQAAADLIDSFADGVWFADLAPVADAELVTSVVAKVVGMTQAEGSSIDEAIPQWLKRKQLLLVLDNCEHVIDAAAAIAAAILGAASQVQIVATSRQMLGIPGEVLYRLPSLAVPETTVGLTAQRASDFGAIALFVDRATASDVRFVLNSDNAPIIAEICRRLDGIPLAIELAAARVKVLSIPNLAQRLNERFKVLTGGSRTALPRQKTLTALISWSYDLLAPQEQTLFNRLSIFAGGFSLDAAAAVCGGDGLDESDIVDLLSMLGDKSLLVADTSGEQERYRLLESTRAYAIAKLAAAGEHDRLARRHAEYFRDQAQAADVLRGAGSTSKWLAAMELDLDNYRAAMDWALTGGRDAALGASMAGGLGWLWFVGGLSLEGRRWIDRAQADLDESAFPNVAAGLWLARCRLSVGSRLHDFAQRAVALYGSTRDARGSAWALYYLAVGLFDMGRFEEASEIFDSALAAMRTLGDKRGEADCLNLLAGNQWNRGDAAAARALYAQALDVNKSLGDDDGTAIVLANLAELAFAASQPDEAIHLMTEALDILTPGKNITHLATDNINMAAYRFALGDVDGAYESAQTGLRWARQAQYPLLIVIALQHLALLATQRKGIHRAAQLIGYVDARFRELGYERQPTERWGYEKVTAILRERLSDAEIETLAAEGAAWPEERALEEAQNI